MSNLGRTSDSRPQQSAVLERHVVALGASHFCFKPYQQSSYAYCSIVLGIFRPTYTQMRLIRR